MNDTTLPAPGLARARALFFAEGREPEGGIAEHIHRSWRRCRAVDSDRFDPQPLALAQLRERREQSMRLLECAQPELDGLTEHALGHGCIVILSDASGLILDEIGSIDFLPKAQRIALTPGVEWSEGNRGTNAIGTALMERQALMVLGGEHYLPQNGTIGCAAAPIFTGRGEIAGVLDISGDVAHVNAHALGLVRMAAQQVEHRMLVADAQGQLLRFHRRPGLLGTAREGLIVIDDGHVVAANRVALSLLGADWDALLDRPADHLFGRRWSRLQQDAGLLTLPGGQQIAATVERSANDRARRWPTSGPAAARRPEAGLGARAGQAQGAAPPADVIEPLLQRAVRVMNQGLPVLVTGETGSGKEVFARRLHAAGRRAAGPFVAVNCAALPETLIEAELFGYEEGAYTGARRRGSPGRVREAHGGILFLDEIGDMPLALQTRLLRVLEQREVTPLGGGRRQAIDFDLVCATHRDVAALVAEGTFRADLMYRVDGYRVALPPLRERADRGALVAGLFATLGGSARRLRLDPLALAELAAQPWPGNVRELASVLRTLIALAEDGETVGPSQLPASMRTGEPTGPVAHGTPATSGLLVHRPAVAPPARADAPVPPRGGLATAPIEVVGSLLDDVARQAIEQALDASGGRVAEAARRLGVHRSTVYRHLAQRRAAGRPN